MNDAFERVVADMQAKAELEVARDNPVIAVFDSLGEYVKEFERELDSEHEIGARLVSFGSSIQIHVHRIGYSCPSLIVFTGVTDAGDKVQLIQHISQLSFLLVAVRKIGVEAHRIGFLWD